MVFQHPFMLRASVQTNVALGLWLAGVRWRDARRQAVAALARVGGGVVRPGVGGAAAADVEGMTDAEERLTQLA